MNAPSQDIATLLEISDIGLTLASDLFISREPASPDNCVTLYDTPGSPPVVFMNKNEKYFYPAIQVRIRNNDYRQGYSLGKQIATMLHGEGQTEINDTYYSLIAAQSEPFLLEYDKNNRAIFIINFNLQRR